jgi:hypothetical protein
MLCGLKAGHGALGRLADPYVSDPAAQLEEASVLDPTKFLAQTSEESARFARVLVRGSDEGALALNHYRSVVSNGDSVPQLFIGGVCRISNEVPLLGAKHDRQAV